MKASGTSRKLSNEQLIETQREWAERLAELYPCIFWRLYVLSDMYDGTTYYDEDLADQVGESAAHAIILLTHEEVFCLWRGLSPRKQAEDLQAYLVQTIGMKVAMREVLTFALEIAPPTTPDFELQFFLSEVYLLFRQVPGVR